MKNTLLNHDGSIFAVSPENVFVTCTDRLFSGWGVASSKTCKRIIICDDYDHARRVARNMRQDSKLKYINISCRVPRYSGDRFLVCVDFAKNRPYWNR